MTNLREKIKIEFFFENRKRMASMCVGLYIDETIYLQCSLWSSLYYTYKSLFYNHYCILHTILQKMNLMLLISLQWQFNLFPFPPQGPWMSPFAVKSVAVHKSPIAVKLIFKFVFWWALWALGTSTHL